jgi:hypothetical protein
MKLRHFLFPRPYLAPAAAPGRFAFNMGIVPLCFTLQFVVPKSCNPRIVFDCSSYPFCPKTPQNSGIPDKTIETIIKGPLPEYPKFRWFLTRFFNLLANNGTLTT